MLILAGSPPSTSPLQASGVWLIKDMVTHFIPKSLFKEVEPCHSYKASDPILEANNARACPSGHKRRAVQRAIEGQRGRTAQATQLDQLLHGPSFHSPPPPPAPTPSLSAPPSAPCGIWWQPLPAPLQLAPGFLNLFGLTADSEKPPPFPPPVISVDLKQKQHLGSPPPRFLLLFLE